LLVEPRTPPIYRWECQVDWYKSGVRPPITRDRLFYFYRLHPKAIDGFRDPENRTDRGRPAGADALEDDVYVTLFLTRRAALTIESGDTSRSFDVEAGVSHVAMPFAPGKQRFVLRRNGNVVIDKTGEHAVSATDASSNFDYFSGSAIASKTE